MLPELGAGVDAELAELTNLVLVCPHHHRLHHRGGLTLTGDADHLVATDTTGRELSAGSLAPTGEHADWWCYQPFHPHPPPTTES